jgi:hypothetical protein
MSSGHHVTDHDHATTAKTAIYRWHHTVGITWWTRRTLERTRMERRRKSAGMDYSRSSRIHVKHN